MGCCPQCHVAHEMHGHSHEEGSSWTEPAKNEVALPKTIENA